MTQYEGLGQYQAKKNNFFDKRESESQTAYEMRVRPYLQHRDDAQPSAEEWAQHRAVADNNVAGQGVGVFGRSTPTGHGLAHPGLAFAGRVPEKNGHISTPVTPGQGAYIPRVYVKDIEDRERQRGLHANWSPARTLRSSGEGWH